MPIDAYSLCPGGTGKKIKFCCPDLLPELEKISRMTEGDQFVAALSHVEHLLGKQPDRACLLALRSDLLRRVGRFDELASNAERFLKAHPENQLAWAESAIAAAASGDHRRAIECVYRAMEFVDGNLYSVTYEAMSIAAQAAAAHKAWGAVLALLRSQIAVNASDTAARRSIAEVHSHVSIPLLQRCGMDKAPVEDGAPWAGRLHEALTMVLKGQFHKAEEKLTALAAETPDKPTPWQWLAEIRSALADTQGEAEALQRLATLDLPWDDAVEAGARAMLIADDPLGDSVDMLRIIWAVEDAEQVETAIRLDQRAWVMPNDEARHDGD
ncbi:MAG: hypothetical protein U1E05_14955, partial [Patescibacteria group bacterium]|nr:hypothetical protein [Patescibacteria group bacterium]